MRRCDRDYPLPLAGLIAPGNPVDPRFQAMPDPSSDRPIVVVRSDGSIGVPRGIRNALLLDPGERVSLGFEHGVLTVRPVETWETDSAARTTTREAGSLDREIDAFLKRRRRRTPA